MLTQHEYLARDRASEAERRAREARVARELAARRRWHRVARYAQAAQQRHTRALHRTASR